MAESGWHKTTAVSIVLLAMLGCSGPQPLSVAIRPADRRAYDQAMATHGGDARQAFFAMKAEREGRTVEEMALADQRISTTSNPFNSRNDPASASLGAVSYQVHCAQCHGENADGRGPGMPVVSPNMDFHDFGHRFAVTLHNGAPKTWFRKISDGYTSDTVGPDGRPLAMPAFKDVLSREQIWLTITYLQSLDMHAEAREEEQ